MNIYDWMTLDDLEQNLMHTYGVSDVTLMEDITEKE